MSVPSVLSVKIATENQYVAILENDFVLSVEKIKLTAVQCPISSTIHSALMRICIMQLMLLTLLYYPKQEFTISSKQPRTYNRRFSSRHVLQ